MSLTKSIVSDLVLKDEACAKRIPIVHFTSYSKVEKYVDSCLAKQSSPPLARIVSSPL